MKCGTPEISVPAKLRLGFAGHHAQYRPNAAFFRDGDLRFPAASIVPYLRPDGRVGRIFGYPEVGLVPMAQCLRVLRSVISGVIGSYVVFQIGLIWRFSSDGIQATVVCCGTTLINAIAGDSARSGEPGMPRWFRASLLSISVSPRLFSR